jgi:tRNA A37 threonylcarbamoyladenosine modification protein TsaB
MTYREAIRLLGSGPIMIAGSASPLLAAEARVQGVEAIISDASSHPDIAWVARLGTLADPAQALPKPLYLREPDAKPQDGARIARQ